LNAISTESSNAWAAKRACREVNTGLQIKPSQVETLALNGGWHAWAITTKPMRFFSICFTKCFRNKKIFFKKLFRKHLRNEGVFETKVKLFLFVQRKDFNLQTKVKVFPEQK